MESRNGTHAVFRIRKYGRDLRVLDACGLDAQQTRNDLQPIVIDAEGVIICGIRGCLLLGSLGCARFRYMWPITSHLPRSAPIVFWIIAATKKQSGIQICWR